MSRALATDLYELNMAASYLRRGMREPATFSLFVRDLPPDRGYLVAAGIEDCLDYLERFRFAPEDLEWMAAAGFGPEDVRALGDLRFTGDVHAVPEGRVVLAGEPLLEVTAPLPEAQIVETQLLNQVTFQTALASKASRCAVAAGGIELVEFSLRRTHGTEAGMAMSRLAAIAGFTGTSNVEAARRYGLRAVGTMAHSYVEAFPTERHAFRAFATDLPDRPLTFLVDTYDPLSGVQAAIDVIDELGLIGNPAAPVAVRLDSGNLLELARQTRALLDASGLASVGIFVSGSLDELRLDRLFRDAAPIDAAGVGTRLGVSADAPYLDSSYKLVAVGGRAVAKLSTGKAHLPGAKQVWRRPPDPDLITMRDENAPPGAEPLLLPAMQDGRRTRPRTTIAAARGRLVADRAALPTAALGLRRPTPPSVAVSARLQSAQDELGARAGRRAAARVPDRTRRHDT
ncbi:MAG: nicotinate phosphoribosyltransferase [Acidimicrobiales bacterium]